MKLAAPSRAVLISIAAALVVVAVWYQALWTPQGAALVAAHKRERIATADLIAAQQHLGHLKHLSATAPAYNAASAKMKGAIPDNDEVNNFLLALNSTAQTAGVLVSSVTVAQPSASSAPGVGAASGATPISVNLSVTGAYFAVQNFIGLLRDGARLLIVDTVNVSQATGAKNVPAGPGSPVTVTVTARIFMSKSLAATAQGSGPAASRAGTGVLETPINKARSTAGSASANANSTAAAGGTP